MIVARCRSRKSPHRRDEERKKERMNECKEHKARLRVIPPLPRLRAGRTHNHLASYHRQGLATFLKPSVSKIPGRSL